MAINVNGSMYIAKKSNDEERKTIIFISGSIGSKDELREREPARNLSSAHDGAY